MTAPVGWQHIRYAAEDGSDEDVLELLQHNPDLANACDEWGCTSLQYAVGYDNVDVVRVLLDAGAGVIRANMRGDTPLHFAAGSRDRDVVSVLVSAGANINATNNRGETPLHQAANGSSLGIVEFLVANGANMAAHDVKGRTPLHIATAKLRDKNPSILGGARVGCSSNNVVPPLIWQCAAGSQDGQHVLTFSIR